MPVAASCLWPLQIIGYIEWKCPTLILSSFFKLKLFKTFMVWSPLLNFSHSNTASMLQSCTIKLYCSRAYWGSKHRDELPSASLLNIICAEEDKCPAIVPWIMESCSAFYNWHMGVLSAKWSPGTGRHNKPTDLAPLNNAWLNQCFK